MYECECEWMPYDGLDALSMLYTALDHVVHCAGIGCSFLVTSCGKWPTDCFHTYFGTGYLWFVFIHCLGLTEYGTNAKWIRQHWCISHLLLKYFQGQWKEKYCFYIRREEYWCAVSVKRPVLNGYESETQSSLNCHSVIPDTLHTWPL